MLRIGVARVGGAVLQAIRRGPIGCHYLAPMVYASPYLAPGLLAIEIGGMPLFWGMTVVAGFVAVRVRRAMGPAENVHPAGIRGPRRLSGRRHDRRRRPAALAAERWFDRDR